MTQQNQNAANPDNAEVQVQPAPGEQPAQPQPMLAQPMPAQPMPPQQRQPGAAGAAQPAGLYPTGQRPRPGATVQGSPRNPNLIQPARPQPPAPRQPTPGQAVQAMQAAQQQQRPTGTFSTLPRMGSQAGQQQRPAAQPALSGEPVFQAAEGEPAQPAQPLEIDQQDIDLLGEVLSPIAISQLQSLLGQDAGDAQQWARVFIPQAARVSMYRAAGDPRATEYQRHLNAQVLAASGIMGLRVQQGMESALLVTLDTLIGFGVHLLTGGLDNIVGGMGKIFARGEGQQGPQ